MKRSALLAISFVLLTVQASAEDSGPIEDNSFLIEEAYNQEAGVVQHINAIIYNHGTKEWEYAFTQEWPVFSQLNQFSYTVPVLRTEDEDAETGFGDMLLNYRRQVLLTDSLAFSPRFSLILPTGDYRDDLGNDALGYQINLPLSITLSDRVVTHWNLGTTIIPEARSASGIRSTTTSFNYGVSAIYLATPQFNWLLEVAGASDEEVGVDENQASRHESLILNPGFRFAINFDSGLQIVPGLAFPIWLTGSGDDVYGIFAYLSFEHPFSCR